LKDDISKPGFLINKRLENCAWDKDYTILDAAILAGNLASTKLLLQSGASPNYGNPITKAIMWSFPEGLDQILNTKTPVQLTTLHGLWTSVNDFGCATVLINHNIISPHTLAQLDRPIVSDYDEYPGMLELVYNSSESHDVPSHILESIMNNEYLSFLLYHFPHLIQYKSYNNRNSLHFQVILHNFDCVSMLLGNKYFRDHINDQDDYGNTPLHYCLVKCLPEDQDIYNESGWASRDCYPAIATLLLLSGSSTTVPNKKNETPLSLSFSCEMFDIMHDLLVNF